MEQQWFGGDIKEELYREQDKYRMLFESIYKSFGQNIEVSSYNGISFSASELRLIFKLQQELSIIRQDKETHSIVTMFEELAKAIMDSNILIAECNYFFIQAYISFLHRKTIEFIGKDNLEHRTQDDLLALAKFSIDLAEFYAGESTHYKHIRLESNALEEYVEERNQNLYELLYSLGSLSTNTKDKLINEIISTIKKEYLQQPPLDDDGFTNLHEYLGYINYHGGDHFLYQTAIDELDNDIHCEVYHLSLPDLVTLLEDDIYKIVDNSDSQDLSDWTAFEGCIKETQEFARLLRDIKEEFMRGVPEYFPE